MARPLARVRDRARRTERSELKNTAYEIFIGVLSLLSIFNLILVYVFAADPSLQLVLSVMNALFSAIFLGDFLYRIFTAPSASRYFFLGYGWADLFASLPFPQLKVLRLFRLLRVSRLLRELGPRTVWNALIHDRANSALMTLLLLGIFVLQFGSLWMLAVEGHAKGANITSASDALWYTIVTISTVGYGDQYPVTNAGRLIGTFIIVVGVGIFGTFTGYLANLFLGPSKSGKGDGATDAAADADATADESAADGAGVADAAAPVAQAADAGLAQHAATGVAAGAVAGAVQRGVDARDAETGAGGAGVVAQSAAEGTDAAAPASTPPAASPDDTAARIRALLAQSEEAMAEVRRLLADAPR